MSARLRTKVSVSLIALISVVTLVNAALLMRTEPPPESVSKTQYQSLIYSVSAAVFYDDHGIYLVDGLKPGPPARFEDVAGDDVGYTIGLSLASRFGLVRFSDETRAFVSQPWSLEGSREFMYGTIRHEIHFLNRLLFTVVSAALALGFLIVSYRRATKCDRGWLNVVALGVSLSLLSIFAAHLLPRLFVWRLHGHGVVATLAVLGLTASLLVRFAMIRSEKVRFPALLAWLIPGALAAGFLVGLIITVRASEGLIWLLVVVSSAAIVQLRTLERPGRRRQALVSLALFLVVFSAGFLVPRLGVAQVIGDREANVPNLPGELQDAYHPLYHSILIGIARSSRNSLGIASEADVVELVQTRIGTNGDGFRDKYEAASSAVFWDYVGSDPLNYLSVIIDNTGQSIDYILTSFGVRVEPFSHLAVALVTLAGVAVILWGAWTRGGVMRFISVVLVAYFLLGFAAVLVTTSPAAYGPATALILIYSLGVAVVLTQLANSPSVIRLVPERHAGSSPSSVTIDAPDLPEATRSSTQRPNSGG